MKDRERGKECKKRLRLVRTLMYQILNKAERKRTGGLQRGEEMTSEEGEKAEERKEGRWEGKKLTKLKSYLPEQVLGLFCYVNYRDIKPTDARKGKEPQIAAHEERGG